MDALHCSDCATRSDQQAGYLLPTTSTATTAAIYRCTQCHIELTGIDTTTLDKCSQLATIKTTQLPQDQWKQIADQMLALLQSCTATRADGSHVQCMAYKYHHLHFERLQIEYDYAIATSDYRLAIAAKQQQIQMTVCSYAPAPCRSSHLLLCTGLID
jgi:hypothetical protein